MGSLRCPHCLAPLPAGTTRCPVCAADPRVGRPTAANGPPLLAPRLEGPQSIAGSSARDWWPLVAGAGAVVAVLGLLTGLSVLALLAAAAGFGVVAWPALVGVGSVVAVGALLQVERRRRALTAPVRGRDMGAEPSDLDLIHLFAQRFAPPASGRDTFRPPLARTRVCAEEAAWRAVAATLFDLTERGVLEVDPHTLPTPWQPVQVLAVRLVRPLPAGDEFAARLLHPLIRRGVGASTTVSELVSQLAVMQRHPARSVLESARAHLAVIGFYRVRERASYGRLVAPLAWLQAAFARPLEPDPGRLLAAQPALAALEQRLGEWDARDPALVAAARDEVLAGFVRARARARRPIR